MNKSKLQSFINLRYVLFLLVCCGFLPTSSLLAQQQPTGWNFVLGAPALESPTNVTKNGFTASWSNVEAQNLNDDNTPWNKVFFRLITTREIEAKGDDTYNIANVIIKQNPSGERKLISTEPALLDEQLSQTAWFAGLAYWTPNGFSINAKDLEGSGFPEEMIGVSARLTSPVMDLSNGDRKYTFEFTAKALQANGDVKMKVFGAGEELDYVKSGVPDVKEISLKNDGKEHKYKLNFEAGTWCHRIVIEINSYAEVEFSKSLMVKQALKKGDRSYRSTSYFVIPFEEVKSSQDDFSGLLGPELYKIKYSYEFKSLDDRCLDILAAKDEGERIAYRMLYADDSPGWDGVRNLSKSMYSEPSYFDNVEEPNNYLYLGYCNYEAPNYNAIVPANPSWKGYHGGAIKLTKEKLKEYVGSNVVGIRFASAASMQKDQINSNPGFFLPKLPCIFLAKSVLTRDNSDINNPKVITPWETIQITPVDKFKNGWNTAFFEKPYEITDESEFFAGAYAYDDAEAGGILVRSYQSPGVDPNSAWEGTNWGSYTIEEALFNSKVSKGDGPLLMQVIIEPKEVTPTTQNRGELRGLSSPSFIYSDEELKSTIKLFNSGVKAISTIKLEADLDGKKQEQVITLAKNLPSSFEVDVELRTIDHKGIFGKAKLKVTLLEVNGVPLKTQSVEETELEILKRDETFERLTLVEIFTTEQCQYCPNSVAWMEELLNKFENAKIKERLAIVSHHAFFRPDFMMLPYSLELAPFFGVKSKAGDISLTGPSSPTNMFDRKPLPALGDSYGQNGSVYSMLRNQKQLEQVVEAANVNPASIYIEVKPWFKKDENNLNILIQGKASPRLDRSRPVYLTIMMTQDRIKPRNQVGTFPIGFMHSNVLRYVDEAGFMGSEVQFDDKGSFEIVKNIPIKASNDKTSEIPINEFLLEDDNKTIEDVMRQVNVIAFLHYYEQLPTNDNVEEKDSRLLRNEVLNAAQSRVSFKSFESVENVTKDVHLFVQNGTLCVNVPVNELKVFDMMGRLLPSLDLKPGVYVVSIELMDGSKIFEKIIVK